MALTALNITALNISQPSLLNVQAITPQTYLTSILPLVYFIAGIVIYSLFIFNFYRFLARRDLIKLKKWHEGYSGAIKKLYYTLRYVIEYLVLIPVLVFFWFAILAALILLLTKNQTADQVLLIAMAIVGAVRVTAYYSEDLSRDLAKMIPFALLGIFIVDMSYFSLETTISLARQLTGLFDKAIFYLVFVAGLELIMRLIYGITSTLRKKEDKPKILH